MLGLFGTGPNRVLGQPLTVTCAPTGSGSLTGLETVEIDCLLTANENIELKAFKLNLPCKLPSVSQADMKVVEIDIDQDRIEPPFLLNAPKSIVVPSTNIPSRGNDCLASASILFGLPILLSAGEQRYLATYTYEASECAAGDFDASLQGFSDPPHPNDTTNFKDAASQLVSFESIGFALTVPTGACCTGDTCVPGDDGGPVNQTCCRNLIPGALFFEGRTCDDDGACDCASDEECDDGVSCTTDSCDEDSGACTNSPVDSACDDDVFCNGAEVCEPGLDCQPGREQCPGQLCNEDEDRCFDCFIDDDCEDFLFCTGQRHCVSEVCIDGDFPCPPTGDPSRDQCNEFTDQCVECFNAGECDDTLYCNGVESCDGVRCQSGSDPCPELCDEDRSAIEGMAVCVDCFTNTNCDDTEWCNGFESCVNDVCQGSPDRCDGQLCDEEEERCVNCLADTDCDDGDICTLNVCNSEGNCENPGVVCNPGERCNPGSGECVECLAHAECDDGAFCSGVETCENGSCTPDLSPPCAGEICLEDEQRCVECEDDGDCDDERFCNGSETCATGFCIPGSNPCTPLACDEERNLCVECTIDGDCDDGNFCNGTETCESNGCVPGTDPCSGQGLLCDETGDACVNCLTGDDCPDDGDACTLNICNSEGDCENPTISCDDGDLCTVDACDEGICVNQDVVCDEGDVCDAATGNCVEDPCLDVVCDDSNVCTDDACNPANGQCEFTDNTAACDDANGCTQNDACVAGVCAGTTIDCNDNVACTDDTCAGGSCVFTPNDANCTDDGAFCNGSESCNATAGCVSSGNPCATGTFCHESTATCDQCLNAGDCDDEIPCTTDSCVGGACVFNVDDDQCPNDGNFCNGMEVCDRDRGCVSLGDPCLQGTFCNEENDSCDQCQINTDCDDGVDCTDDRCVDGVCIFVPNSQNCPDDGIFCNGTETCDRQDGCFSSGDPCTPFALTCNEETDLCEDLCDSDEECDDGLFCNGAESCNEGLCEAGENPCNDNEVCNEETDTCDAPQQDPVGAPIPANTACGASGSGCGPAGPAMILILLGLMALRLVGPRVPRSRAD